MRNMYPLIELNEELNVTDIIRIINFKCQYIYKLNFCNTEILHSYLYKQM